MGKHGSMTAATMAVAATAIGFAVAADMGPVHALAGGPFEASGVTQAPGGKGVLFVDDRRPDGVIWMELAPDGSAAGKPVAVALGVSIDDPEGITADGTHVYVVGSQSRGSGRAGLVRFRYDAARRRAVDVEAIEGVGALLAAAIPALQRGSRTGALNIEGLAWDARGRRLLLGLRAPLDGGRALVVPVKPRDPRGAWTGANLEVGAPIALDLGGAGVRSIEADGDSGLFWLIAGGVEHAGTARLMQWDGTSSAAKSVMTFPDDLKPEGVARTQVGGKDRTLVVCDTSRYVLID